jgi:hypothetical protein
MSRSQCDLYDSHVRQLKESFEACCVPAISGADELVGVVLGDRIGHISVQSEEIVFDAFVFWVCQCECPVRVPSLVGDESTTADAKREMHLGQASAAPEDGLGSSGMHAECSSDESTKVSCAGSSTSTEQSSGGECLEGESCANVDPALIEVERQLSASQMAYVKMEVYSGKFWGKCFSCYR